MRQLSRRQIAFCASLALAGVIAVAGSAVAMGQGGETPEANATSTPTASPTQTAVPTATALPTVEPVSEAPKPIPLGPIQSVVAEPVVVHTGDGDCLNVRSTPGTQFAEAILFCAPEGHVLWLTDERTEMDGEVWARALGLGWVALRYTTPADPGDAPLPEAGVAVALPDWAFRTLEFAWMDGSEAVAHRVTFTADAGHSIGWQGERVTGTGAFVAFSVVPDATNVNATTIATSDGRILATVPKSDPLGWSEDRLLLRTNNGCGQVCLNGLSIYDAGTGEIFEVVEQQPIWVQGLWTPEGDVLAVLNGRRVERHGRNDGVTVLLTLPEDGQALSEVSLSGDGTRLLSSGFGTALRVYDLATGSMVEIARAPQRDLGGGRCGSGGSGLSAWLDDSRIAYHENYAERGFNGVTIVEIATGDRSLIPFSTVQDLRGAGDGLLSFTTVEYRATGQIPITWLMDVETGETWPVVTGQSATWLE